MYCSATLKCVKIFYFDLEFFETLLENYLDILCNILYLYYFMDGYVMKKSIFLKLFVLSILLLIGACAIGDKNSNQIENNSLLHIQKIEIGKLSIIDNSSSFLNSTKIYIKIESTVTSNWSFGFYSPRTYKKYLGLDINNQLELKICDLNELNCNNMEVVIESDTSKIDKSSGYITILKTINPVSLKKEQQYIIELLHSNQGVANNYSNIIQSIFFTNNNVIYNINTDKSLYDVSSIYKQDIINLEIESHNNNNYSNSESIIDNNLILPSPVSFNVLNESEFYVFNNLVIHDKFNINNFDMLDQFCANYINDFKKFKYNCSYDNELNANSGIIIESISDPSIIDSNPEGYQIKVYNNKIIIFAINKAGIFYAFQTLRQLWQNNNLLSVNIIDYPRFKYRGLLLDVARHYFTVSEIESIIDIISIHKLNTLHIHFSDDEGFRIDLESYPEIKNIGAKRQYGLPLIATMLNQQNLENINIGPNNNYPLINTLYSYTYTNDDIQNIIKYANNHNITVIPEIDIPGHARALIKSLPNQLSDKNDSSIFMSVQGYNDNVLPICQYNLTALNQFTLTINNIINQINQKFNNQTTIYAINNEISIGGDEVSSHAWESYNACNFNGWQNLNALEKSQYFFKLLSNNFLNYKLSGWQQFVQTEGIAIGKNVVTQDKVGHIWVWNNSNDGISQAVELANNQYPTVLAFADQTYFDVAYSPDFNEPGFNWSTRFADTHASLLSALSITDVIKSIPINNQQYIKGIEATLWSENIPNYNHLIYMMLPKLTGMAQASWASEAYTVNYSTKKIYWLNLIHKLGTDDSRFLGYLHNIYNVNYRGYPQGISMELPKK